MLIFEYVLCGFIVDFYWDWMRFSLIVESYCLVVRKGEMKIWNVIGMDGVICRLLFVLNGVVVMLCIFGVGLGFFW